LRWSDHYPANQLIVTRWRRPSVGSFVEWVGVQQSGVQRPKRGQNRRYRHWLSAEIWPGPGLVNAGRCSGFQARKTPAGWSVPRALERSE